MESRITVFLFKNQQKWNAMLLRSAKSCIWALKTALEACGTCWGLGASAGNHPLCSRYQTVDCNLRTGRTSPRHRKARYHYQHTRSARVLAWDTAYLGHTSSRKMNSSWNSYRERLIEAEQRGELILQRRLSAW